MRESDASGMGERAPGGSGWSAGPAGSVVVADVADVASAAGEVSGDVVAGVTRVGYAPIVRVDALRREVELCATSEAIDSYGTVFDYAASKDAFTRWIGNVREMHERRAVGQRVAVRCDDDARKVYVRVRISRGAADTWEKVLDGTLRGASIGASNVVWQRQARRVAGRERLLNVATRYDLAELSLVDSPSNPDALGISIVRDAVPVAAVLERLESEGDDSGAPGATDGTREGGQPGEAEGGSGEQSAECEGYAPLIAPVITLPRRTAPRRTREHAHRAPREPQPAGEAGRGRPARGSAATSLEREPEERGPGGAYGLWATAEELPRLMAGDETRARGPFSANDAGSPDMGVPARAEEPPTEGLGVPPGGRGNASERFHAVARAVLLGCGCPLCEGAMAALGEPGDGRDALAERARASYDGRTLAALRESALARALAAGMSASVARLERVDAGVRGMRSALTEAVARMASGAEDLRSRVEALEAQPLPGGPAARPVEKVHALAAHDNGSGAAGPPNAVERYRALEALAGRLTDPQAQIAVAAEMIRLQRGE